MRKIHIAIVDDGVNEGYFDSLCLKHNVIITEDLNIMERFGYDKYKISHGTICAAIIKKYCSTAKLSSVKILNENMRSNVWRLINAIKWCIYNKVDIINLSLGSVYSKDKSLIKKIIDKAYNNGLIVVAAKSNDDIETYPACFNNVLGVKSDKSNILEEGQYIYNTEPEDGIEITACGKHKLMNYLGEERITPNWNSYAAPMISAIIADMMKEHEKLSLVEIKEKLWRRYNNISKP